MLKNISNLAKTNVKNEENNVYEDDYLEELIGEVGVWQVAVCAAASISRYVAMGNMLAVVFLTPETNFICAKFRDNATTKAENMTCYDNCEEYVFHSDVMERTLISDFGLICKDSWLASFTQTILMLGLVIGVTLFGWMSDRFGRRISLITATVMNLIASIPLSFATYFWIFNCLRLVAGIGSGGCLIICIPIVMEVVGKRYREIAGALYLLPDGLSEASLALFAYLLPAWDIYLLGFNISCIVVLVCVCFVPESPRWLVSNGKVDEAIEVITRAAKCNKRNTTNIKECIIKHIKSLKLDENEEKASYWDLVRTKETRIITFASVMIWTVIGITYYGIYQYMSFLGVNVFLTVAILGLIQVPMLTVEFILTKLYSRKASLSGSLIVTGLTMIVLVFTPKGYWYTALLGIIGFAASSISFAVVYVYEAELVPTNLRNMAFGFCSCAAKIGSMASPFIATISPVWVPSLIFAVMSIIGAAFCFMLPETKGKNLKDVNDSKPKL